MRSRSSIKYSKMARRGDHSCCNKQAVRKGLWAPDEDLKLISYIRTYGTHGCWSTVPLLAGLERCGKSCRLRWINYLRPDVKRGNFTPHEALLIIELQKILGNRWAQMVKHLPGRTDNEIKNFWNSSIKKKLMASRAQIIAAAKAAKEIANSIVPNNNQVIIPNPQMDVNPMIIDPNTQMGHPMVIPSPPPPVTIIGFDGPIETTYDPEMMMVNPNIRPQVAPSVVVPAPPDFNDLPPWPTSPYSPPLDQTPNYDGNFMHGFEIPNTMLDNYYYHSNPYQMQGYNQDSAVLNATMAQIRPQAVNVVGFGPPFSYVVQEQVMGQNFGPVPGFGPIPSFGPIPGFGSVHPTHINNIEALMTSFASPSIYSTDASISAVVGPRGPY